MEKGNLAHDPHTSIPHRLHVDIAAVETGEGEVWHIIRGSVIHALAATGEWPIRVDVVTSKGPANGQTKRWFVEYETGPYGQVIDDQPDEPV